MFGLQFYRKAELWVWLPCLPELRVGADLSLLNPMNRARHRPLVDPALGRIVPQPRMRVNVSETVLNDP
jgi:hypothetical protein